MPAAVIVDHPAASLQLARLRDATTPPEVFRRAARTLGTHLASAALELLPTRTHTVRTPLGDAAHEVPGPQIVAVPVLRAGLGLLDGVAEAVPGLHVGMIGLARNEETHVAEQYYRKVPPLEGRWVFLLEPMLATGGSAAAAAEQLDAADVAGVTVLSVVATEQALERVHASLPEQGGIVVAAVDPELDDDAYIVPGLGDFGDRLFGTP